MNAKPQPNQSIKEIITRRDSEAISIFVSSEDADEFVHDECHEFGHLIPLDFGSGYGYLLYVSPFYDPREVEAYILSYNGG